MARAQGLEYDHDDPLAMATLMFMGERRKEVRKSNQALRDYAMMGPGRTLERLWESYLSRGKIEANYVCPAKNLAFLRTWSMAYAWQERVRLYDKLQEAKRQAELDEFWRQARGTIPQEDYRQGKRLRELIDKTFERASDFIEESRTVGEDGTIIIRQSLNVKAMTDALKVASDIQRKAAGLDKEKKIVWTGNISDLPRPLLERIVAGEDPDEVVKDLSKYAGNETESDEENNSPTSS